MSTSHEHLRIEARVKDINRLTLQEALPEITERDLNRAITFVAAMRARYLKAVMQMAHPEDLASTPDHGAGLFDELAKLRQNYTEAVAALDALRHAIEQEYVDLAAI